MRPRLSRKVRLQWDQVRERPTLLYPEGMLMLNPTAQAVLELCDSQRTIADIARELAERYDGGSAAETSPGAGTSAEPDERAAAVERDVIVLLERLDRRGWLADDAAGRA